MDAVGLAPRVNVKFIFDGEEEIGSPFFGTFTEKHRDLLAADLVLVTDGPKHDSGRPTVSGGARGNIKLELEIEVGAARRALGQLRGAERGVAAQRAPRPPWRRRTAPRSSRAWRTTWLLPTAAERRLMAEIPVDAARSSATSA